MEVRGREIGIVPEGFRKLRESIGRIVLLHEQRTEIVVELGVGGVQFDGATKRVGCAGEVAREFERMGKGVIGGGGLRREFEGRLGLANGAGRVTRQNESAAEVYVCFDEGRVQAKGILKFRDGGLNFALVEQHPAEHIVGLGVLGVGLQRSFESFPGGCEITASRGVEPFMVRIIWGGRRLQSGGRGWERRGRNKRGAGIRESDANGER
jgi:hypothetical protein